jgi:predicted transcriptional regulator
MNRYQIQLDERLAEDVRELARQRNVSFSQVVREAVGDYVAHSSPTTAAEAWASAIGCFRDPEFTDVSKRHDEFAWDH